MKKFNKKVAKKQEPEEEVESGSEDEETELAVSGDEDEDDVDDEEDEEDDDNLLDNEAEEDDGEEEEDDEEGEGEDDDDEEGEEDDEEDSDSDDEDNPLAPKKIPFNTPKVEIKEDLVSKFMDMNGKRLYIRFPSKLPDNEQELLKQLKSYCGLIKTVIKPRQKHARFCMVEFDSKDDREKGLKKLSTVKVEGKNLVVKMPTMEDKTQIETALEKQENKKKEKKMKQRLRRLAKKEAASITSTLFVANIPPTATVADLKEHFPNAIDIKVKHNKNNQETAKGSVTLPTPEDATKARKLKIKIDENELLIKFDVSGKKGSWRAKQNKKYKQSLKNEGKPLTPGQKRKAGGPVVKVEKSQPSEKKVKTEAGQTDSKVKTGKKKYKKPKSHKKAVGVSV
ncbi:hypothetical protein ACFFRR_010411 [Megaselia abdita]